MFDLNRFGVNKAILISLSCFLLPAAIATASPSITQKFTLELLAQAQTTALEPEILAEINRARTQPQAYADWLEEQKQYYDGAVLRLPGETTLRTNRGFKALQEAIAFLRQQQPLPPLTSSKALTATAKTQLEAVSNFPTANISIDNISYGVVTPQAIVMQLIVDDRFPDRRRRLSLFAPELEQTGIVCQSDERYSNICAIAYEPETGAIAAEISSDEVPEVIETSTDTTTLPQATQPRSEETTDNSIDDTQATTEESNPTSNPDTDLPNTETGIEIAVPSVETIPPVEDAEPNPETNTSDRSLSEVAVTQNYSQLLEKVERGTLETGDKTIPDDGSFYDSYPLEGQAGDSFIISLESDEFDTFVAILDPEGNIIEQNDDISDNNSNSRLRVTLPDSGIYNVLVNAYDKGGTGRYILTIRR